MTARSPEEGHLLTSAQDTAVGNKRNLVQDNSISRKENNKEPNAKWYKYVLCTIFLVSGGQIIFHELSTPAVNEFLRFEPSKIYEIWRTVTYKWVHDGWSHLAANMFTQCSFGSLLELNQGRVRVLAIYELGGVTGVLGAACISTDLVIGASAGGFSLYLANVADLMLNYETIAYNLYRAIGMAILVPCVLVYEVYCMYSKSEPPVSWQAHLFGALTGMFLGLVLFKCKKPNKTRKVLKIIGFIYIVICVIVFIVLIGR